MHYAEQAAHLLRHLEIGAFRDQLAHSKQPVRDRELETAVLDAAARFAEEQLSQCAAIFHTQPPVLLEGGVALCSAQAEAWQAFCAMGWLSIAMPEPLGQNLPLDVLVACEELFNRASAAFYMLPTSTRCGASLLQESAPDAIRDEWVPRLLAGEWSTTICISEPDAGSDVGRIRTKAVKQASGWHVSGEKCWISFGSHNLTNRIGHLMLARTNDALGVRGLSLFLVPSVRDDGSQNGVTVSRLEHKMGLHASPTCGLIFDKSDAFLLGDEGRGLNHMFHMMLEMRLSCGPQGIGVASDAYAIAKRYAAERRQGGAPNAAPVAIDTHADIQRALLDMAACVETGRALNVAAAQCLTLVQQSQSEDERERWHHLAQFLLPLVKDNAAWSACAVTSQAIQILGGAGYTAEWSVERLARDSRVFPIFEGTTGIQALDLVHRRLWRDNRAGLDTFLKLAREQASDYPDLAAVLDHVEAAASQLMKWQDTPKEAEAGAVAFLELCKLAVKSWLAARLIALAGNDETAKRIKAAARFALSQAEPEAHKQHKLSVIGTSTLAAFADLGTA